jgi:hypothetical protein
VVLHGVSAFHGVDLQAAVSRGWRIGRARLRQTSLPSAGPPSSRCTPATRSSKP